MRIPAWFLLILYVALIAGLGITALMADAASVVIVSVTVASLVVFIFGAGTRDQYRPIHRGRQVAPVAMAALMIGVLVFGMAVAVGETVAGSTADGPRDWVGWVLFVLNWSFWGVVLYVYTRKQPQYLAVRRLATMLFAGSLAELLAVVPAHLIVSRRSYCFAGLGTGLGAAAGLCVMLWSFGPGILLLTWQEAERRRTRRGEPRRDVRKSDRAGFQYSVRAMLLLTTGVGVVCGLINIFWSVWIAAAVAASAILVAAGAVLLRWRWLMLPAAVAVIIGLLIVAWGKWILLAFLSVYAILLLALVVQVFQRSDAMKN